MRICKYCGAEIKQGESYCRKCSAKIDECLFTSAENSLHLGDANAVSGNINLQDSHNNTNVIKDVMGDRAPITSSNLSGYSPTDNHNVLSLGDANAINGNISLQDSHNVTNIDHSIHYEAQKTETELKERNESEFFGIVQRRLSNGPLDKLALDDLLLCSKRLHLDEAYAIQIIKDVQNNLHLHKSRQSLSYLEDQQIKEIAYLIETNQVDVLKKKYISLEGIAKQSSDYDVLFYYYLLQASFYPESLSVTMVSSNEENYWKLFWGHITYIKQNQNEKAANILSQFGTLAQFDGTLSLLMAFDNLIEFRKDEKNEFFMQRAQDYLMQSVQKGFSDNLVPIWHTIKEAMLDEPNPPKEIHFYCYETFKELYPNKQTDFAQINTDVDFLDLPQMQDFNPIDMAKDMNLGEWE